MANSDNNNNNKRDLYEVLNVPKTATDEEIKKAYVKLAKQYHPDINKDPDAPKKFEEVQNAYDILSDKSKRQTYDQFGFAAFDPNYGASAGGGNPFASGSFDPQDFGFGGLGDIFSQFFGGGGHSSSRSYSSPEYSNIPTKGRDVTINLNLSFEQAIKGTNVEIPYTKEEECPHCHGNGAKDGTKLHTCSKCNGTGRVLRTTNSLFGTIQEEIICPDCKGKGKVIDEKCPSCNGQGFTSTKTKTGVNIPAGVDTGTHLRLQGKGRRGYNGGPNGDLYLTVNVKPHEFFVRQGLDIYVTLPISVIDLILGTTVVVPTVFGDESLSIPAGTNVKTVLRMRGKGVKNGSRTGDQYVTLDVIIPTNLTNEQKELLCKFSNIETSKPATKSFFQKVKDKFKKK